MIAAQTRAQIVQIIGKIVLLYRPARKPSPKLSNLLRYSHLKD
jgi:RNA-binding protein